MAKIVAIGRSIVEIALRLVNPATNCASNTFKNALAAIENNKTATPVGGETPSKNSDDSQIGTTAKCVSKTSRETPRNFRWSATKPKLAGTQMLAAKHKVQV